jgi:hypothetical protein
VWALVRGKPSLSAGSKNTRDGIYVFLGPGPSMSGLLMLASNRPSKTASIYKWAPTDNPEAPNEFKMAQEIKTPVSTAWRKNEATGEIECLFKIPLSLFGAAPQTGDVWSGNFFRRIQDDKKMADYIWEPNMNWKTWRNRYDVMGKIIFE